MLKIFNVRWSSEAAGPSPFSENERTELFLAGCKLAAEGTPCRGCFNSDLWQDDVYNAKMSVQEVLNILLKHSNRYLTIVGGEPLDQYEDLVELCQQLKDNYGFHIIVITHYEMDEIKKNYPKLLNVVNVIIDGVYDERFRIFNSEATDGLHNAVGSANQVIWDLTGNKHKKAGELKGLKMTASSQELIFI